MFTPGLCLCGSWIQLARLPGVFGSVPAAIVLRLAMCVRLGARRPCASVPCTVWHMAQLVDSTSSLPRCSWAWVGGGGVASCCRRQAS